MRVTIWNEFIHERKNESVSAIYPQGIHGAIGDILRSLSVDADNLTINYATLNDPEHGLDAATLENTDVLLWWGHLAHHKVADDIAAAVQDRVLQGMGLLVLHSAHLSKVFKLLMGTTCNLRWREADDRELLWSVNPSHPICAGIPQPIELAAHEMYGEFFDIPAPDEQVFISSFSGGEVFRSGCCFHRGKGRVFYFSPGHETYPIYHDPIIGQVLLNATRWAYQPQMTQQAEISVANLAANIETTTSPNAPTNWWRAKR